MLPGVFVRRAPDRRNNVARQDLLRRVRAEFQEMPALRLTCAQMQRLFGMRFDICQRVIAALVREGLLARGTDERFGLKDNG